MAWQRWSVLVKPQSENWGYYAIISAAAYPLCKLESKNNLSEEGFFIFLQTSRYSGDLELIQFYVFFSDCKIKAAQ